MDEQNKNTTSNEQVPSGFDSVTNITNDEDKKFNPTPMFSANQQNTPKDGYTVTPEGGYFTRKAETKAEPDANNQPSNKPAPTQTNMPSEAPKASDPTIGAHDFIPNGTYSYSAAKGNLQSSAFETPEVKKTEPAQPANQPVTPNPPVSSVTHMNDAPPPPPVSSRVKEKKPKKYGAGVVIVSAVLAAIIGMGGGVGAMLLTEDVNKTDTQNISSQSSAQNVTNITVDETVNSSIEAVAKKSGPSIIGIRTTAAVTSFFGGSSEATEEGSGIIYTADGYIITNYHVIQSAVESSNSKVEVFLPDDTDTALTATVIGYNIASDLAVVKINKTGLPAIEFADSDNLSVGQYAIAIGNPGGLEFIGSVSYGVISGLNRSVAVGTGGTMSLIQTDAAINPGNSGGALVNISGQLIGVNSVKLVSESYEGMGFAIPSNTVKEICDNIIAKQNEPTPYIGIQISQSYSAAQLTALGYPAGAVVVDVIEGGPASESGIQRGDIITEFNGVTISNYTDLDNAISNCSPGDSVSVKLYRAGRFYSTNINVEANNEQ